MFDIDRGHIEKENTLSVLRVNVSLTISSEYSWYFLALLTESITPAAIDYLLHNASISVTWRIVAASLCSSMYASTQPGTYFN